MKRGSMRWVAEQEIQRGSHLTHRDIDLWLIGGRDAGAHARVEAHITLCEACERRAQAARKGAEQMREHEGCRLLSRAVWEAYAQAGGPLG